jgi:DNA-binding transcriptional LysR family regulator
MRYRQVDLNLFVVFDALIRTGSVSRTSKALGVSQGAVSQALAKLRVHFGDELFLKKSTGVAPTAAALALADHVRQFVALSEAALASRARFDPLVSDRDITLCMADMGEIRILPELLNEFRVVAPGCRVVILDLWGEELREGFESGRIDLAISARTPPPPGDILQQKLMEGGYAAVSSRESNFADEVSLADFATAPQVVVTPGRLDHARIDQMLELHGIRRNPVVSVANWLTVPHILEMCPSLLAVAPKFLAHAYRKFDLKILKLAFDLPQIETYQFWHRRAHADPFNLWLRATVREVCLKSDYIRGVGWTLDG